MSSRKVAVVTGSNKGIGYAIVKGLCEKYDGDVYLTARDAGRGQAAVEKLKSLGLNPLFHQLDVSNPKSIDTLKDHLKSKYGGLDVLINNAAISFESTSPEPILFQFEETIRVNYYATKHVCDSLFPLLRKNGRVVNVSSSFGHLSDIPSPDLKAKFADQNLTVEGLNKLIDTFIQDVKEDKYKEKWGDMDAVPYVVSKVGLSRLSFIQQKLFDAETPNRNISVNAVHPGYIATDMTRELMTVRSGAQTIEDGARAPLFLALESNLKGQYVWKDCTVVDWYTDDVKHLSPVNNLLVDEY